MCSRLLKDSCNDDYNDDNIVNDLLSIHVSNEKHIMSKKDYILFLYIYYISIRISNRNRN